MRKTIVLIAQSLDGFISDKSGGVAWLDEFQMNGFDINLFLSSVDTVIVGWNTYHQVINELSPDKWPYEGKKTYVITHRNEVSYHPDVEIAKNNLTDLVKQLRVEKGKEIWILGGAKIVNQLIKANLVDEYHISTMPVILGEGTRLFENDNPLRKLSLVESKLYGDVLDTTYIRKEIKTDE
jgi:dihydrofolate reductase